jgi:hypothetical protein
MPAPRNILIIKLTDNHILTCEVYQKVRDHWEDQDVGGWTILKWIFESRLGWI